QQSRANIAEGAFDRERTSGSGATTHARSDQLRETLLTTRIEDATGAREQGRADERQLVTLDDEELEPVRELARCDARNPKGRIGAERRGLRAVQCRDIAWRGSHRPKSHHRAIR